MVALAAMWPGEPVPCKVSEQYEMQRALLQAGGSVGEDLAAMDVAVSSSAAKIGSTGLNSTLTRQELVPLGRFPWAVDTITVNDSGIVEMTDSHSNSMVSGEDLNNQAPIQRLYSEKVPVMSDLFLSADGKPLVVIASPVFSPDGKFIGATSLMFRPGPLFVNNTPVKADGAPWDIWVMQPDGLLVYDPDPGQPGRNIFSDPFYKSYPDLIRVSGNISRERQGTGSYTFIDASGQNVRKEAAWTTIGTRGTEWRLVITRVTDSA